MHAFVELIDMSTGIALDAIDQIENRVIEELQHSAATRLVKTLQATQLQRAILAVGMFSIFESILQDRLGCQNGFDEARKYLEQEGECELKKRFSRFAAAINTLKHGRGRSYDALCSEAADLPFRIKRPDESFFCEGDVSEISTLVEVDNKFIFNCSKVIQAVSDVITKTNNFYL